VKLLLIMALAAVMWLSGAPLAYAGESNLILPDLTTVSFFGVDGRTVLAYGLLICVFGLLFGLFQYRNLRAMRIHPSMSEMSELIYETCKTYLITQGRFILILEVLVGIIIVAYFGWLSQLAPTTVLLILASSIVGIVGSYSVAWFGMRINTLANSRSAFFSLKGRPYPTYSIPLQAGMSIGMLLISVELLVMLAILLFVPREYAGPCFIGFAIGESLGASVLRIAGGIFTKIADIGSDLMKIEFNIKEDDARNPGVIADCTGDNAGDSVGPTADGFETYGVTGVALITFIVLAVKPEYQALLLVWIFVMRLAMILTSGLAYWLNNLWAKAVYGNRDTMNFERPLTSLVWLTSILSVVITYVLSYITIRDVGDGSLWWKLATVITCGTMAGAVIPEVVKIFTSTDSQHVKHVVNSSAKGGASLNILAGLTVGNFSAYWMGMVILALMGGAYIASRLGLDEIMMAETVFAFGLVAFGFLGLGPVTIAVDSYGPVADNAQSIYELSLIETIPGIEDELQRDYGFKPNFEKGKEFLEANDGCGNTFKATAKPVLIGTAVVGSTTMIFSIIVLLTKGLTENMGNLSILHPPFLLGMIAGGAMIYWFTGASMHAVTSGAYYAVEYIKANIRLDGVTRASTEDSKKVVAICTKFAQKGMINIFIAVFFATLAYACFDPYFFIGYLIAIALFGLFQAIFMANAGGAWDNAKKIVEVDLKQKGTALHAATVVGDTVGDPFKDTSSVAMNPVIKFTTLFGLLAIEMAIVVEKQHPVALRVIAVAFFAVAIIFILKSFFDMRIKDDITA
jgi:K(+)-stimulated pyrophosphate-energized sodium pump